MTLLALFSAALAADPISAITEQLSGEEGPSVAFACAPLSDVFGVLERAGVGPEMASMMPEKIRYWLQMADPAVAAEAGLHLDGSLVVTGGEGQGMNRSVSLNIPFSGSGEQADDMVAHFSPRSPDAAEHSTSGWDVSTHGEHLQLRKGPTINIPVDTALLSGLPTVPGCAALVTGSDPEKVSGSVLLFAPFDLNNDSFIGRVSIPGGLTLPPPTAPSELPDIRTETPPLAIAVMGIEPIAFLQQESLWEELGENFSFSREEVDNLAEKVRIMPGSTIAIFGNPKQPQWVATLPVARPSGRVLSTWKLRRGLKKADPELDWTSRTTFTTISDDGPLSGMISTGQFLLSNDNSLLAETQQDSGTPWISDSHAAHVADWPLSIHVQSPDVIPGVSSSLSAFFGMQLEEEYLEMSLLLPDNSSEVLSEIMKMMMMGAMQKRGLAPQLTPL